MSTLSNIELQEKLSNDLERIEMQFGHVLGKAALFGLVALPLIPGLLTMISIGVNFPGMLHIPSGVAWVFGAFAMIGIEVLGLFSIRLALRMRKYNQRAFARGLDLAPIGQGYTTAGFYLLTVIVLTVLLKIFPALAVWSLIPLALMGALADWVFALNGDHNERESALRKLIIDEQAMVEHERAENSEVAKLRQQLEDERNRSNRFRQDAEAVRNGAEELRMDAEKLQTESEQLRQQLEDERNRAAEIDIDSVLSRLDEGSRDVLTQIMQAIVDGRIASAADAAKVANANKTKVYEMFRLATAIGVIYMNGDGAYHVRN